jgi:transcriptional/translational regulatory protein YebC/TACO1
MKLIFINNIGNLEFIVSNVEEMGKLQEITDELKLLGRTTLGYLPKDLVSVTEEQFEQNMEIIDILDGVDDVETVFHNMNTAE